MKIEYFSDTDTLLLEFSENIEEFVFHPSKSQSDGIYKVAEDGTEYKTNKDYE